MGAACLSYRPFNPKYGVNYWTVTFRQANPILFPVSVTVASVRIRLETLRVQPLPGTVRAPGFERTVGRPHFRAQGTDPQEFVT